MEDLKGPRTLADKPWNSMFWIAAISGIYSSESLYLLCLSWARHEEKQLDVVEPDNGSTQSCSGQLLNLSEQGLESACLGFSTSTSCAISSKESNLSVP